MNDEHESLQGQLLIASPALLDPNFRRSVVLVTAHDLEGAMGLVLSRPTPATVAEAVPPEDCPLAAVTASGLSKGTVGGLSE